MCDGNDVRNQNCLTLGEDFTGGTLACNGTCDALDSSGCTTCGDGTIEGDEVCEGSDLGAVTMCAAVPGRNFTGGTLACDANTCEYDLTGCTIASCGNNMLDMGEECEAGNLNGETCQSRGFGGGTLGCASNCLFDESQCNPCGNGMLDAGEVCDGSNFGSETCQTRGFGAGTLACNNCMQIDTSGCDRCGNGAIDFGETCDGANVGTATCQNQGFAPGGVLSCTASCQLDTSGCNSCGNGVLDGGEVCDDMDFGSDSCVMRGFGGGALMCNASCNSIDTSSCTAATMCGNNILESGEVCDGTDFGGATCVSRGYTGGMLSCSGNCMSISEMNCISNPLPGAEGDLVITEFMANPNTLTDSQGEWIEVYNPTGVTYNLENCVLMGSATEMATINAPLLAPAGGFITLARTSTPGFTPDFVYNSSFNLNNTGGDTIELVCPSGAGGANVTITEVIYTASNNYPASMPTGSSLALDPMIYTDSQAIVRFVEGDNGVNWCPGSMSYNGDNGTPGAANATCGTGSMMLNLYFSEYVEGMGNNKAVEIYNAGRDIQADTCTVNLYQNGSSSVGASVTLNSVALPSGNVYVLCHPLSSPALLSPCDQTSGSAIVFNGNDVVELVCDDAGTPTVMDVIGEMGSSAVWSSGGVSTQNETLRRKCSVTVGDTNGTNTFSPDAEWDSFPQDTFGDVGQYICP